MICKCNVLAKMSSLKFSRDSKVGAISILKKSIFMPFWCIEYNSNSFNANIVGLLLQLHYTFAKKW